MMSKVCDTSRVVGIAGMTMDGKFSGPLRTTEEARVWARQVESKIIWWPLHPDSELQKESRKKLGLGTCHWEHWQEWYAGR